MAVFITREKRKVVTQRISENVLGKGSDKIMTDFPLQTVLTEREVHVSKRVVIAR